MKFSLLKRIVSQIGDSSDPDVKVRFRDAMGNPTTTDLISIKEEITHAENSAGERIILLDAISNN